MEKRRRSKFWGWGYEGDGLSQAERASLVGLCADRFGIEPDSQAPPSIEEVILPPARIRLDTGLIDAPPSQSVPATIMGKLFLIISFPSGSRLNPYCKDRT